MSSRLHKPIQVTGCLLLSALSVSAATFTWDGGGADNKTLTAANWVGDAVPGGGQDLVFSAVSTIGTAVNWDLANGNNPRSVGFDANALAYTVTGTNTIQLTTGIIALANDSAANQSISNPVHVFFNNTKTFNTGATANGTTLALGAVSFRSDTLTSGQNNQLTLGGSNLGSITTLGETGTFATGVIRTLNKTGAGTWTISGGFSGGASVNANAGTLILSGANTFTGTTTINIGGTVRMKSNNALGPATVSEAQKTDIKSGGTLEIEGSLTSSEFIRVAGTGISGTGAIRAISGTTNHNTQIAMEGTGGAIVSIGTDAGAILKVSRLYSDPGRDTNFEKTGAGTLVLKADTSDDYLGTTTVTAGTLQVGDGATTGELKTAGVINNSIVVFNRSNSYTWSGDMSGTGTLEQAGSGTLTLSGANTHAGITTISAGSLIVNGSLAGAITVNAGTLGGSGTIAGLVTTSGAGSILSPGNSPGTLTLNGGLNAAAGATFNAEIGTGTDIIVLGSGVFTGSTASGGLLWNFSDSGGLTAGIPYTLSSFGSSLGLDAGDLATGTLPSGFVLDPAFGSNGFQINANNLQVQFAAIPEPTITAALLAGLGLLLGRRRR